MEEHVVEECRGFPYARAKEMAPKVLKEYVRRHGGDDNTNDKEELIRRLFACWQDPDGRLPGHSRPLPGTPWRLPILGSNNIPQRVTHEYGQLLDAAQATERRAENAKRLNNTIDSSLSEATGSSTVLRFAFVEPVGSQAYMGVDRAVYADPRLSRPSRALSQRDRRMGPILREAVWKSKFYARIVLNHSCRPPRHRRDACSLVR